MTARGCDSDDELLINRIDRVQNRHDAIKLICEMSKLAENNKDDFVQNLQTDMFLEAISGYLDGDNLDSNFQEKHLDKLPEKDFFKALCAILYAGLIYE